MTHRPAAAVTVMAALVALLAGCGDTAAPAGRASGAAPSAAASNRPEAPAERELATGDPFNAQDVQYVQMMHNHQKFGMALARLAAERGSLEDVRNLGAAIVATESVELTRMESWLGARNIVIETGDTVANPHASHGGLPGTTQREVDALAAETAPDFDNTFLNLMIGHQQGGVAMARTELARGQDRWVRSFAGQVEQSRAGEVSQMLRLLG